MNNFIPRITNKCENDNYCYAINDDGEYWIKDECAYCECRVVDNLFFMFVCNNDELCENG